MSGFVLSPSDGYGVQNPKFLRVAGVIMQRLDAVQGPYTSAGDASSKGHIVHGKTFKDTSAMGHIVMKSIEGIGEGATFILSPLFLWFCLDAGLERVRLAGNDTSLSGQKTDQSLENCS